MVTTRRAAVMADLEALPEGVKGEIIEGVLYTQPRPRFRHQDLAGSLIEELRGPFQRGKGGPGGWWILVEPGISLPGSPEFSPDLAGWRRERLALPESGPIEAVPDWVCEILSPSTRHYDQRIKRPYYAGIGIGHLWIVDLEARTLSVQKNLDGKWLELGIHDEHDVVRAEPFSEIEMRVAEWWPAAPAV